MRNIHEIIPDEVIEKNYCFTALGEIEYREHLRKSLLKIACNYSVGSGTEYLLIDMGLLKRLSKGMKLTELGNEYLYSSYTNANK